ncbi:MAG: PEGA domain-containing protein [Opitutaceae bacterium]|jgi:hypothetical protein|nr:PEGA domain-containing protein [Opitutaceae bacterium]
MKTKKTAACLAALLSLALNAGAAVTTSTTTESAPPQTATRTFVRDGKTITETVTTQTTSEAVSQTKSYKAAIFVANRAGPAYDSKIASLADFVAARVADIGVQSISRETAVDAARKFDPELASSPRPADSLDSQLSNQSSALRLAQNLGADYLLQCSLGSVATANRSIKAYGVQLQNTEYSALVSYKILDGNSGAALTGDTLRVSRSEQQNAHASADLKDAQILDALLDDAAAQIANGLAARIAANRIPLPSAAAQLVTITITPDVADVFLPSIKIGEGNVLNLSDSKGKVSPLNVTVEIDGVAVGTAPGAIQVRPGFSKIRLTREGFEPWERIISAREGQIILAPMKMTDAGMARYKELASFIQGLKNGDKLTDAQVKVLEGQAEQLRNSFKREDYKMDTKDNVQVTQKTLF